MLFQAEQLFSHKMITLTILSEIDFVHLLSLKQHLFSSQLEISHLLNGTTPKNQHRNREPKQYDSDLI